MFGGLGVHEERLHWEVQHVCLPKREKEMLSLLLRKVQCEVRDVVILDDPNFSDLYLTIPCLARGLSLLCRLNRSEPELVQLIESSVHASSLDMLLPILEINKPTLLVLSFPPISSHLSPCSSPCFSFFCSSFLFCYPSSIFL